MKGVRRTALAFRSLCFIVALSILVSAAYGASVPAQAKTHATPANSHAREIRTNAALLSDKDTVVLSEFDNHSDVTVFTDALTQALALELGQSPFLDFLSDRQISEALLDMGLPATAHITQTLARKLCLHSGSKAIIGGSISGQAANKYRVELTAVSCSSGVLLDKESRDAAGLGNVLRALNTASYGLRANLGEPLPSIEQFNVPAYSATSSLEALRNYSIGLAVRRSKGDTPTVPYLKRAIALDPRFPLPYVELTAIYRNFRQPSVALQYAAKAYELRSRATEREKLNIIGTYYLATGDLPREIGNYELWQSRYPRDFQPYNNLGNDYAFTGELDKSRVEYEQALRLMPSLISYTNVIGIEINLDRLDAAGACLDEAFAKKLDGRYLRQNLYWLAFLRGNPAQMHQQLEWAAGKPGDEDALLSMQSDTEAFHGRLTKAADYSRRAAESALRAGSKETAALWTAISALRMAEVGQLSTARTESGSALALSSGRDVKLIAAFALAHTGDNVRAKMLAEELQRDYPTDFLLKVYWLATIDATLALNNGDLSQALKSLEIAAPYELGVGNFVDYLYPAYVRGQVYLKSHQGAQAAAEFQKVLDHPGVVLNFITGALAQLEIARAYAAAGTPDRAKAAYEAFFALWKDADAEIPALKDAHMEYLKLLN
jgi:eukaryotic-like serine/threonine-protein kinase